MIPSGKQRFSWLTVILISLLLAGCKTTTLKPAHSATEDSGGPLMKELGFWLGRVSTTMSRRWRWEFATTAAQRLARLYERKLAALESLKKSLRHQAFTGAL